MTGHPEAEPCRTDADKVAHLCAISDAKSKIVDIVRDGNFDWSGGVGNSEDLLTARSELIRLEEGK